MHYKDDGLPQKWADVVDTATTDFNRLLFYHKSTPDDRLWMASLNSSEVGEFSAVSMPRAPASEIAAVSSAFPRPVIPPHTMGCSIPVSLLPNSGGLILPISFQSSTSSLTTSLEKINDFVKDGDSSTTLQFGKRGRGTYMVCERFKKGIINTGIVVNVTVNVP